MRFGGIYFRKTFFSYFLPITALIAALAFFAANRLHSIRFEGEQRVLWEESRLTYDLIEEDLRHGNVDKVREKLKSIAGAVNCRFTLIDDEGRVVVDTEANPTEMENHRLRPEVVAAAAQGEGSSVRYSHTVNQDLMYLARREKSEDGKIYFMRMAVPLVNLYRNLKIFDIGLAFAASGAIVLAGLACFFFARDQANHLIQLAQISYAISKGEDGRRTHVEASGELGQLSQNLNAIGATIAELKTRAAKGREELDSMLASMSDGLIATDLQQRILLANSASGALLDFKHAEAPGKMLWEVIDDEATLSAASSVVSSGKPAIVQSGPRQGKHIEVAVSPLRHGDRAEGVLIVARDATRSIQYQELRKEFVANVSHELRTPLTLIKGYVETLQDGGLNDPEKAPVFLATIDKNVNQLTNLVNDLLEISKLESRAGVPHRTNVNVAETVRKVVDLLAPAAAKKGQNISVELPPAAPAVSGDPDYLERAVSNLLDNAIKYTPEKGRIRILASTLDSKALVEVIDSGIGIPPQDLPRIFERFYRVDKSRSREMGGTGLGLAIVKHIALAHGGTIEVSSDPGKGSTFRLVIPAITEV